MPSVARLRDFLFVLVEAKFEVNFNYSSLFLLNFLDINLDFMEIFRIKLKLKKQYKMRVIQKYCPQSPKK